MSESIEIESESGHKNNNNVETYTRRVIPTILFSLSFVNVVVVWLFFTSFPSSYAAKGPSAVVLVNLSVLHAIYTFTYLFAPRFVHKGRSWFKSAPWIVSGISMFTIEIMNCEPQYWWILVYCSIGIAVQSCMYLFNLLPKTAVSPFVEPFEMCVVPSMLSKVTNVQDLINPPPGMFGPPIRIDAQKFGQHPPIIRYGSHAVITQPMPQMPTFVETSSTVLQ